MNIDIYHGDCRDLLEYLPSESVHCIVTSPPYFVLRDYNVDGQMGLEPSPDAFVEALVGVLRQCRRVLRNDGTLWLNIGDSYAGSGRGGNPTKKSSTLQGGHASQEASMVRRTRKPTEISGTARDAAVTQHGARGANAKLKQKDLIGIPWMTAFALRADGWYLRQDVIWHKPNPMPESVRDRCTKAHEYVFLLSKSSTYYFNSESIQEPATGRPPGNVKPTKGGRNYEKGAVEHRTASGLHNIGARQTRNRRSVWSVSTRPFKEAHFATFPPDLIRPCILASCPEGGVVMDPFFGAGTTGLVASQTGRNCIGIELNPDYIDIAKRRLGTGIPAIEPKGVFA